MARGRIPIHAFNVDATFASGARMNVTLRGAASAATVYAAETGTGTLAQPLTADVRGRFDGWLERGAYAGSIVPASGVGGWTEEFDVSPGADGSVDAAWLPDGFLAARHVPDKAIPGGKLADAFLGLTHIPDGLLSLAKLAPEVWPAGVLLAWAGGAGSVPPGWLYCDGAVVSRTTYAALYAAIGTAWNTGGEATTDFRLPDFRGRVPLGEDTGGLRIPTGLNRARGQYDGAATHTLTTSQLPAHRHAHRATNGNNVTLAASSTQVLVQTGNGNTWISDHPSPYYSSETQDQGGGSAHNNLQPYGVVGGYIIKT